MPVFQDKIILFTACAKAILHSVEIILHGEHSISYKDSIWVIVDAFIVLLFSCFVKRHLAPIDKLGTKTYHKRQEGAADAP